MDGTGVHTFSLLDAAGREHGYIVPEMPASIGLECMFELLGLGAPTVLSLAGAALRADELRSAVLSALQGADSGVETGSQLAGLAAELDLSKVGDELSKALATGRAPALTRKLLTGVRRDGHPLNVDLAYQANYWELLQLLWKIIGINRFFPQLSTGASSSPAPGTGARIPSGVA